MHNIILLEVKFQKSFHNIFYIGTYLVEKH